MWRIRTLVIAGFVMLAGCSGNAPPTEQTNAKGGDLKVDRDNPCSVLFPAEVAEIFGVKSQLRERVEEGVCHFHFEQADGKRLKSADGESFIRVTIDWEGGKTMVTAQKLAGKLIGGSDSGFEQIQGVGDEAWMAPLASMLTFSKGSVGVEIDLRLLPGEREKAIQMAQRIAGRI